MVNPAVAVSNAVGDDACMTQDNANEPPSPPCDELLNLLRRIADHDDAPSSMQVDARDYLRHLTAAAFGSGPVKGEARVTGDPEYTRVVVEGLPRPGSATG